MIRATSLPSLLALFATLLGVTGIASSAPPELAAEYIDSLHLSKQSFGNYFAATFSSDLKYNLPAGAGTRGLAGTIYNLFALDKDARPTGMYAREKWWHSNCSKLKTPSRSSLLRIKTTEGAQGGFPLHILDNQHEIWNYYDGDGPIIVYTFDFASGNVSAQAIGTFPARPQYVLPNATWNGALLAPGTTWALTGATTVVDFDPSDSHFASESATTMAKLYAAFPSHHDLIERLTSF